MVHNGTCGNSSLETPPIGFNKLRHYTHHCQAAAREQEKHNYQVEQEHAHNHATHDLAAAILLTPMLTNIFVWLYSVVFARLLIGGLYSELSAAKAGVLVLVLSNVHLEALFIPPVYYTQLMASALISNGK